MDSLKGKASIVCAAIFIAMFTYGSTEDRNWFPDFLEPVEEVWPWVLLALVILAMLLLEEEQRGR